MSVSLALVPVALALRVVMGKKRFESWIDSLQVKIPTSFKDEQDLLRTVRKAGYDADKFGGSYKTHIRGEEFWFYWEQREGVWTAVFSTSDAKSAIKTFIRDLETKAGRRVFQWQESKRLPVVLKSKTFPTNFRDAELLYQTLTEYGLQISQGQQGKFICKINEMELIFSREQDQPFSLEVKNVTDMRQIYLNLDDINDTYTHNVQARTYEKLKERIEDRGLFIENEEVAEDNSIMLTLSIQS